MYVLFIILSYFFCFGLGTGILVCNRCDISWYSYREAPMGVPHVRCRWQRLDRFAGKKHAQTVGKSQMPTMRQSPAPACNVASRDKLPTIMAYISTYRRGKGKQFRNLTNSVFCNAPLFFSQEMTKIVQAIYDMLGNSSSSRPPDTAEERAKSIFARMDENGDGKLTEDEFLKGCLQDEELSKMLSPGF